LSSIVVLAAIGLLSQYAEYNSCTGTGHMQLIVNETGDVRRQR